MSRLIFAAVSIFFLINAGLAAKEEKVNPQIPYKNALDSLKEQKFEDALSWFDTVKRDFKGTPEYTRASVVKSSILLAMELASLKVMNLFHDSLKWLTGKERAAKGRDFEEAIKVYEERARSSAKKSMDEIGELLGTEADRAPGEIKLNFLVNTSGWDVSELRDSIQKGKMLEEKEIVDLYKGEFLANFLGFLSEIIPMEGVSLLDGSFAGTVDMIKFYRSMGERFLINARNWEPESGFAQISRKCFEKVLALTENNPYGKERHLAQRGISELVSLKNGYSSFVRCPRCSRLMSGDWKFCPYDGADLKPKK